MKKQFQPDVLLREWLHDPRAVTVAAFALSGLFLGIAGWLIQRNIRHNEPGLRAPWALPFALAISASGLFGANRLSAPWGLVIGGLICVLAGVLFYYADHRRFVRDPAGKIVADRWHIVLSFAGFRWTRDKANRHFFFSGDTGSSKTSGMNRLVAELFRRNPTLGGVVMANKGDEWSHLEWLAKKYGREHDLIHLRPRLVGESEKPLHRLNVTGDAPDRRAFILTRSAFPGQQRYAAAVWSGDIGNSWETLRRQVVAGLDYVVTGLPWWTTDTGGFFRPGPGQYTDAAYHERFLRWLQYSTFTPLLRVHGYQTDTEPWRYGPLVEAESRRWLALRTRLLPYLYSEAARVSFAGSTLMRPLVLDFPDDARALDQKYEFMFGPALLVAPVLAPGVKQWPVYLPKTAGGWFDFWTGERRSSGITVSAAAPLEQIPLHVRAGSILPLGPDLQYTGEKPADPIELRVFPGVDGGTTLYEDQGTNYAYEQGACARIPLHWDERRQTLTLGEREGRFPGMIGQRTFRVIWVRPGHGVGGAITAKPDAIVSYAGHEETVTRPRP